ncbi:MAG: carbamoyltransferase HypF [Desulfobulbus propionicus]|nr:MAG: carbamoyltransferase HypF [Desulfobulbus propionicus]
MQLEKNTQTITIAINGIVQGVGFRPFVYREALELGITGTVSNSDDGVRIIATAPGEMLELFIKRLQNNTPPVATIASLTVASQPLRSFADFTIISSRHQHSATVQITPDLCVCNECLAEIRDKNNRRYQYPFTNCTNCGPRFSIIEHVPYDRPNTSMRTFPMCRRCQREYDNPLDRRFHAQPNACPVCGPSLSWHDNQGELIATENCIHAAAKALHSGKVVAIKGLGGFHLAVDGFSKASVALLRKRKKRPAKPLAVMARDIETAKKYCHISAQEAQLLCSPQHPIVLLTKKDPSDLAANLAANLGVLGVMLPYTPLHALLLEQPECPDVLVMTSGNTAGEPICTNNEDALKRLSHLADLFLLHNRDIVTRVDDSVTRVMDGATRLLRRGRGYSPVPIPLEPTKDILACGAEMKNTFCIVRNNEAYLGQHIGELSQAACYDFYRESIDHLKTVLECTPSLVAHDRHPDYFSTRYATGLDAAKVAVQHHHAHTAAVLAEHRITDPVLSIILDGTGYGDDSTIFGGEIYVADRKSYQRKAHLEHLQLPGGDQAVAEPWRTGFSLLHKHFAAQGIAEEQLPSWFTTIAAEKRKVIGQLLEKGFNSPLTSSCGRLFDGLAALTGTCLFSHYEGQAAMELEYQAALCEHREALEGYQVEVVADAEHLILSTAPLIKQVMADINAEVATPTIAYRFHLWLVNSLVFVLKRLRQETGLNTVTLSGGCIQNRVLFELLTACLRKETFEVYSGQVIPVNDGGIALGQAYIVGAT